MLLNIKLPASKNYHIQAADEEWNNVTTNCLKNRLQIRFDLQIDVKMKCRFF